MNKTDSTNIDFRVKEIQLYVEDNNLEQAAKRLGDLATDFSKKHRWEATNIARLISEFKIEKRKHGSKDVYIQRMATEITEKIMMLSYSIAEGYKQKEEETKDKQQKQGNIIFPNDKFISYDDAKKNFIRNYRKNSQFFNGNEVTCQAVELHKKFRNNKVFELSDISFMLRAREIIGVVGENGNGKTTLLRIISGDLAANKGTVIFPFLDSEKTDWLTTKQYIGYIPQQLQKWYGLLKDNLHFSAALRGIKSQENTEEVNFIIYRLGLDQYCNLKWNEISAGYQTRFELAKILIWKPRLLVLDEPLANLDIIAQSIFLRDLRDFADSVENPLSIIITSQHLHAIESVADKIMVIKDGDQCK